MNQVANLKVNKSKYKSLVDSSIIVDLIPDIIAEVDNHKDYTWLNQAGLDFFGEDKAIGQNATFFFAQGQELAPEVEDLFSGKNDFCYVECWQRRQDGQKRLLAWYCRSLKNTAGKVIGAISIAHDITDSHNIEEKLRKSESLLLNALGLAQLGVWEYDIAQDMFTFNDAFYAIFKTNVKEVGSYTMSSAEYAQRFVYSEDVHMVAAETQKAIASKDPNYTRQLEHRMLYADGTVGQIAVRFFTVRDKDGKAIKTYGINQDITDIKKREDGLRKMRDKLQKNVEELKKINKLMVDRELKMIEMKKLVGQLKKDLTDCRSNK